MWEQRGLDQCEFGRERVSTLSYSDEDAVTGIALAVVLRTQRSTKPWMRDYLRQRYLREGHGAMNEKIILNNLKNIFVLIVYRYYKNQRGFLPFAGTLQ